MTRFFLIVVLILSSNKIFTQTPDAASWFIIQLPVKIDKKWQWQNETSYRTLGISIKPYQFQYTTGIKFILNTKWSIANGGTFSYTRTSYQKLNHEFGKEFRIWQEMNFIQSVSKTISVQNRFRIEERWIKKKESNSDFFGLRFRNRVSLIKEITKKWKLQLGEEYMMQYSKDIFSFNQNKVSVSLSYKINPASLIQPAYIWLKWPKDNQHILSFTYTKYI